MAKTTKKKAVKVESISLDEVKALAQNEIDPVYLIDLTNIDEPHAMARLEINPDQIAEIAQSISEIGLLQPILLRKAGDRYEIVAGHCRFLAHKKTWFV